MMLIPLLSLSTGADADADADAEVQGIFAQQQQEQRRRRMRKLLFKGARNGNEQDVQKAIDFGVRVNRVDGDEDPPLGRSRSHPSTGRVAERG